MTLLAIDTSAEFCAVCLYDIEEERVLSKISENISRGHAEKLMPMIADCLNAASIFYDDITAIAVTNGPGSFTGVRVGLAAARGLALSLEVPISTITTLAACIEEAQTKNDKDEIVAIIDARRDEAYVQIGAHEPFLAHFSKIGQHLPTHEFVLCGSGAQKCNEITGKQQVIVHHRSTGDIETIARMAACGNSAKSSFEPLYLRSADAKPQSGFTLTRA